MSEWLAAFSGIAYPRRVGADVEVVGGLPDVIAPRLRNRLDTDSVLIPIRTLHDVAQRINGLSEALVEAQGGLATGLGPQDLAKYEQALREAEKAAIKVGVLVIDANEPSSWSALYDHSGKLVEQGHGSNVLATITNDGWSVTKVDAEGILFDWGTSQAPDENDLQEFPATLAELQRHLTRRAKEASP